jgi:hypothetical protein
MVHTAAAYQQLSRQDDVVELTAGDGSLLFFTSDGSAFVPDEGAEGLALSHDPAADHYLLEDASGTTTTFSRLGDVHLPTAVTQPGRGNTTAYRYEAGGAANRLGSRLAMVRSRAVAYRSRRRSRRYFRIAHMTSLRLRCLKSGYNIDL